MVRLPMLSAAPGPLWKCAGRNIVDLMRYAVQMRWSLYPTDVDVFCKIQIFLQDPNYSGDILDVLWKQTEHMGRRTMMFDVYIGI